MRRGTTPTHTFICEDISLLDITDVFITYKQGKHIILEKTIDDVEINPEDNTISVFLTQQDTLKFKDTEWTWLYPNENSNDRMVKVQIRIKYEDGTALASNVMLSDVLEILKDGEI